MDFPLPILAIIFTSLPKGNLIPTILISPHGALGVNNFFCVVSYFRINITFALSAFMPLMPIAALLMLPYIPREDLAALDGG